MLDATHILRLHFFLLVEKNFEMAFSSFHDFAWRPQMTDSGLLLTIGTHWEPNLVTNVVGIRCIFWSKLRIYAMVHYYVNCSPRSNSTLYRKNKKKYFWRLCIFSVSVRCFPSCRWVLSCLLLKLIDRFVINSYDVFHENVF